MARRRRGGVGRRDFPSSPRRRSRRFLPRLGAPPPRLPLLVLRGRAPSSIPVLPLSGSSAEFGPSLASAAECEKRGGEDENVGGRPCSVSGLVVAARPADACSSPLTFEPAIPAGSTAAGVPLVVVVERGSCDFEAKVSAVARALPPGPSSSSSSSSAGAAAVVVLSGDDAPLSMGRRSALSPLRVLLPGRPDDGQGGGGRSGAPEGRGRRAPDPFDAPPEEPGREAAVGDRGRSASERPVLSARRAPGDGARGGSDGGGDCGGRRGRRKRRRPRRRRRPCPSPGGRRRLQQRSPSQAWAPSRSARSLRRRRRRGSTSADGSSGGSGSETSGSGNSGSLFSGTPLLQQLLATVARSREFAALLQQVAREEEKEKVKIYIMYTTRNGTNLQKLEKKRKKKRRRKKDSVLFPLARQKRTPRPLTLPSPLRHPHAVPYPSPRTAPPPLRVFQPSFVPHHAVPPEEDGAPPRREREPAELRPGAAAAVAQGPREVGGVALARARVDVRDAAPVAGLDEVDQDRGGRQRQRGGGRRRGTSVRERERRPRVFFPGLPETFRPLASPCDPSLGSSRMFGLNLTASTGLPSTLSTASVDARSSPAAGTRPRRPPRPSATTRGPSRGRRPSERGSARA